MLFTFGSLGVLDTLPRDKVSVEPLVSVINYHPDVNRLERVTFSCLLTRFRGEATLSHARGDFSYAAYCAMKAELKKMGVVEFRYTGFGPKWFTE